MPMISPRLPLPNQLAITLTTLGQPEAWSRPAAKCAASGVAAASDALQLGEGLPQTWRLKDLETGDCTGDCSYANNGL